MRKNKQIYDEVRKPSAYDLATRRRNKGVMEHSAPETKKRRSREKREARVTEREYNNSE